MDKISPKDIDWLLNLKQQPTTRTSAARRKPFWLRFLAIFGFTLMLLLLPFFLLIRFSVYMYVQNNVTGWLALASGIIVTIVLLVFYLIYLFRK